MNDKPLTLKALVAAKWLPFVSGPQLLNNVYRAGMVHIDDMGVLNIEIDSPDKRVYYILDAADREKSLYNIVTDGERWSQIDIDRRKLICPRICLSHADLALIKEFITSGRVTDGQTYIHDTLTMKQWAEDWARGQAIKEMFARGLNI